MKVVALLETAVSSVRLTSRNFQGITTLLGLIFHLGLVREPQSLGCANTTSSCCLSNSRARETSCSTLTCLSVPCSTTHLPIPCIISACIMSSKFEKLKSDTYSFSCSLARTIWLHCYEVYREGKCQSDFEVGLKFWKTETWLQG